MGHSLSVNLSQPEDKQYTKYQNPSSKLLERLQFISLKGVTLKEKSPYLLLLFLTYPTVFKFSFFFFFF